MWNHDELSFRNGLLRLAIGGAELEHMSLICEEIFVPEHGYQRRNFTVPLSTIFPVSKWPRFRYFGFLRFVVKITDVISSFSSPPPTLESVELSYLKTLDGTIPQLLQQMRDRLGWEERLVDARPKVSMAIERDRRLVQGMYIWLDKEVNAFLYVGGQNPFDLENPNGVRMLPDQGFQTDEFDPAYSRQYLCHPERTLGMG